MGGRVRRRSEEKEHFWRQIVDAHAGSGLSVRRYCSDRGVSEQSFFAWRKELARRDAGRSGDRPSRARYAEDDDCCATDDVAASHRHDHLRRYGLQLAQEQKQLADEARFRSEL
jgi:hypothetical protein